MSNKELRYKNTAGDDDEEVKVEGKKQAGYSLEVGCLAFRVVLDWQECSPCGFMWFVVALRSKGEKSQ